MKIGSLFDGSGGFPLSASMCGIEPVWASEVEPFPIAVTRSRFPNMKHLGSVTDVKGDEVEPVDVITFGSPCQDLSVAGKRAGLKHTENGDEETTRSGLFMEAIRIIKEMRKATNGLYPRFAVWENVPGAFSSNKGEDFRIVLEEFIKVIEPSAVMPTVPKNGWPYADSYCGDGWSLGYRVLDAQYWGKTVRDRDSGNVLQMGTPQRRRRIYLVADFRGERAREVLFEREGLRGYFAQSGAQREAAARDAESGSGTADCTGNCVAYSFDSLASNSMKSANPHSGCRQTEVSKCLDTTNPDPSKNQGGVAVVEAVPYTLKIRSGCAVDSGGKAAGKGALIQENMSATLAVSQDQYLFQPILDDQGGSQINVRYDGKSPTLRAEMHGNVPCVMEAAGFKDRAGAQAGSVGYQEEVAPTLLAEMLPSVCYSIENHPADSRVNIDDSGKVQCLTSRMGTGGGNVPMVMEPVPFCKSARARSSDDATTWKDGKVANTLNTFDLGEVRANELVVESAPTYCIEGNGSRPSHMGDGYNESDTMYTLNTIERHAVCYSETYQKTTGPLMANSHPGSYSGQDAYNDMFVVGKEAPCAGVDCRNATEYPRTERHSASKG